MAKAGHVYPQAVPRAADLMDPRVTTAPRRWSVDRARAAARASGASTIAADLGTAARLGDIERAAAWGLGRAPWVDVAYTGLAAVSSSADEITVRRLLRGGAPLVLVRAGRRIAGVIEASARLEASLAGKLERLHGSQGEATLWLLRTAGKLSTPSTRSRTR